MTGLPAPEDMSHAMLIAVLMHHGGSLDLPASAFEPDALGAAGAFHSVQAQPGPPGTVRLSVVARPPGDAARIEVRPWSRSASIARPGRARGGTLDIVGRKPMSTQTHARVAPIPRTIDGIADALPSAERARFNAEARTTEAADLEACLAKWWGVAVLEAAAPKEEATPPGTVSMTSVFLRRIAAGGAIDWNEIDAMRERRGARHIDWDAIDRARVAAGAA
ncbi:hypothetical protein [Streptomyces sp. NPDC052496]|uniref:hypothetical protein n=1 Tax=Streptomyces sp. NPDC052496 TaxID=3154951 RepID=UPI0034207520